MIRRVYWSIIDQYPIRLQGHRFTAKQVQRPQRIFSVTHKGKPRRTARSGFRMEVNGEDPADHVFVNSDAEC